jgi:AraC-like DNA-binding protein
MLMRTLHLPPTVPDASSMYRHEVFRCSDLGQSQAYLRKALSDHELRCGEGKVDSALYTAGTSRVKMMVLRYGPEVEIKPRPFDGFSLVQIPLRGSTEIDCDGQRIALVPGQSAMISPRRQLRLVWSRDCEQLLVRVPHSLAWSAVQAREKWRNTLQHRPSQLFSPITMIDGSAGKSWNGLVQTLIDLAAGVQATGDYSHAAWSEHNEIGLAVFLLTLQRELQENVRTVLDGMLQDSRASAGRGDPLVAAERYVRARLCAPIALEDIARAAGVSARTLHIYCTRQHGSGPMEWLRNLRLDVARDKLQQSRTAQVTDVATACGFGHLGRFAAYYRERFGELPRDTAVTS